MATEPVSFIPALREAQLDSSTYQESKSSFAGWLTDALGRINGDLVRADQGLEHLATGEAQNLHQVMIALEEARIGVQLLVQVRNRLLEAYQDVLRMQI
jgi:flagellar hook-basal body complex protein FliE